MTRSNNEDMLEEEGIELDQLNHARTPIISNFGTNINFTDNKNMQLNTKAVQKHWKKTSTVTCHP